MFVAKFLAINNPILSEYISLPLSSITPHRSPSPSKPKPISAYYLLQLLLLHEAFQDLQDLDYILEKSNPIHNLVQ